MTPPQSELSKLAQQYNSLLWQLKGNIGSVKGLQYRIPRQHILLISKLNYHEANHPHNLRVKLGNSLAEAVNQLEYCEYLIRQLSESHREAHKYTMKLTQEKESEE
jgi:hypothetical protein